MGLTPRQRLPRWWFTGWLLTGILACTGEVAEEPVPTEPRDTGAQTRETADVESNRVLAEQGDAGARGRLGEAYYLGKGVAQDFGEALRWARLAAEQGNARGQGILASAYNTGSGVAQDFGEALRWARLAAEQRDVHGQTVLGFMYLNGNGVGQDDDEAARWAGLAAEQGHESAQILLGMLHINGRGVEQNDVSAYMWLTLGGERGMLEILARRMTPEQIAEAEERARGWGR